MSHFGRFSVDSALASSKRRFDSISAASAFSGRLFLACKQSMSEGCQSALLLLALRLVGQGELDETFLMELEYGRANVAREHRIAERFSNGGPIFRALFQ